MTEEGASTSTDHKPTDMNDFIAMIRDLTVSIRDMTDKQRTKETVPHLKPSPFTPDQDFGLWLTRFEAYSKDQAANIDQKKRLLIGRLGDVALQSVYCIDPKLENSYEEIVKILKERFIEPDGDCHARMRFQNTTQKASETLDEYLTRVRVAAQHAFPAATANFLDEMVLDRFIMGLNSLRLKETMMGRTYRTPSEAVLDAKRLFAAHETCNRNKPIMNIETNETISDRKISQLERTIAQLSQQIKDRNRPVCSYCQRPGHRWSDCRSRLNAPLAQGKPPQGLPHSTQLASPGSRNQGIVCFACNKPGHKKSECRSRPGGLQQNNQRNSRPTGGQAGRPWRQNNSNNAANFTSGNDDWDWNTWTSGPAPQATQGGQ